MRIWRPLTRQARMLLRSGHRWTYSGIVACLLKFSPLTRVTGCIGRLYPRWASRRLVATLQYLQGRNTAARILFASIQQSSNLEPESIQLKYNLFPSLTEIHLVMQIYCLTRIPKQSRNWSSSNLVTNFAAFVILAVIGNLKVWVHT